jgi:hypothetical protein
MNRVSFAPWKMVIDAMPLRSISATSSGHTRSWWSLYSWFEAVVRRPSRVDRMLA